MRSSRMLGDPATRKARYDRAAPLEKNHPEGKQNDSQPRQIEDATGNFVIVSFFSSHSLCPKVGPDGHNNRCV